MTGIRQQTELLSGSKNSMNCSKDMLDLGGFHVGFSVVTQWWGSGPYIRKITGSNPILATT